MTRRASGKWIDISPSLDSFIFLILNPKNRYALYLFEENSPNCTTRPPDAHGLVRCCFQSCLYNIEDHGEWCRRQHAENRQDRGRFRHVLLQRWGSQGDGPQAHVFRAVRGGSMNIATRPSRRPESAATTTSTRTTPMSSPTPSCSGLRNTGSLTTPTGSSPLLARLPRSRTPVCFPRAPANPSLVLSLQDGKVVSNFTGSKLIKVCGSVHG